jgi:alcohol dehydrogenase class IV
MAEDYIALGLKRIYILTVPQVLKQIEPVLSFLESKGIKISINTNIAGEPTFKDFSKIIKEAREFEADSIAGIGGGSVMDVAKLVAALLKSDQDVLSVIGTGLIKSRETYLVCIPTTSGTGSEVSPNSILFDEEDGLKKGIISPYLVPDGAYIDPALTLDLPPNVTAYTGIDALTHCIEAVANKFAHPMTDTIALEGIRLIGTNLLKAVTDGHNLEARTKVALGSVYGGMCLGPVNTAAVHALAYPLGSTYKIAHGLSNALLLPYIMEFNLDAAENKYAAIAIAIGANLGKSEHETAKNGIALIRKLIENCKLPLRLSDMNIPADAVEPMAKSALTIQRLLKNNVREVTLDDAISIYKTAYS